ncbi:fungal-specific transcription factor domain-containing protein [Mycena leptocephala]|nr:fungal-specific transcription factor domain-containing protein [Mycena leptocephala]
MSFDLPLDNVKLVVPAKKRRAQGACDACRQKRRGCDGLQSSTRKCTYCVDNAMECTFTGAKPTTKRQSYTKVLEARLAVAEKLLQQLSQDRGQPPGLPDHSQWSKNLAILQHSAASASGSELGPGVDLAAMSIRGINEGEPQSRDEDEVATLELVNDMQGLKLGVHSDGFMGKSSAAILLTTAIQLKKGYTTLDGQPPELWRSRRLEYWMDTPWQQGVDISKRRYVFPPPDALSALVDLYFQHINLNIPLLHRPTFERAVADNLHLRDDKFAMNVLLVCAAASRFSDDPRVFDAAAPLTCGWKYFNQVFPDLQPLFLPPTLYDLQRHCLALMFLEGAAPQASWKLVGSGIRLAQEIGAHRRQTAVRHTVEAELWRRAFWVLVMYDRIVSCGFGRPCAMQYDDFDLDWPTECDDEYMEHDDPAIAFRQPPGKPSRVAFFSAYLRLNNILAFSLRIVYSLNKAKDLFAAREAAWEERLVAELDSALNKWVDSIPEHLRWDAHRADPVFFRQSVALYCGYYYVQMTTHRPFIPMIRHKAPTSLPSLAICTNAARSCSHIVDVWCKRMNGTPAANLLGPAITAGMILMLNVWSGKRTGVAPHNNTAIAEVHKCMEVIRLCETRWQMAGVLWDVLSELASVGQVPLPTRMPAAAPAENSHSMTPPTAPLAETVNHRKRAHSGDHSSPETQDLEPPMGVWADPLALPPGFVDAPFAWLGATEQGSTLPLYGTDLGRLPIFPSPEVSPYAEGSQVGAEFSGWVESLNLGPSTSSAAAQSDPLGGVEQGWMSAEDILSTIDNDAIAKWANAPTNIGFRAEAI